MEATHATELIEGLTKEAEMNFFEEHLHEMYTSWVLYQENPNAQYRADVTYTYSTLRKLLLKIKELQS